MSLPLRLRESTYPRYLAINDSQVLNRLQSPDELDGALVDSINFPLHYPRWWTRPLPSGQEMKRFILGLFLYAYRLPQQIYVLVGDEVKYDRSRRPFPYKSHDPIIFDAWMLGVGDEIGDLNIEYSFAGCWNIRRYWCGTYQPYADESECKLISQNSAHFHLVTSDFSQKISRDWQVPSLKSCLKSLASPPYHSLSSRLQKPAMESIHNYHRRCNLYDLIQPMRLWTWWTKHLYSWRLSIMWMMVRLIPHQICKLRV